VKTKKKQEKTPARLENINLSEHEKEILELYKLLDNIRISRPFKARNPYIIRGIKALCEEVKLY